MVLNSPAISFLKLLPPKVEPGQRHLMGVSATSNGLLVSERAVVEVGEEEDQLVVIPGDNLLLQCSGPVAKVRQCVWYSPGSRTSRCCFGDCGRRERRCRVEEGRQVRREVEAGLATCQLYLAGVREGEEGLRYCNKYPRNCCALCSVWKAGKLCCSV